MCSDRAIRNRRRRRGGFTLMEVLIALAILVILGSVTVLSLTGVLWDSKNKAAKIKIDAIKQSIDDFFIAEGRYPQTLQELTQVSPKTGRNYMQKWERDPWDRDYLYQPPDQIGPMAQYKLWSTGPNGQDGDEDDVTNLQ